MSALNTWGIDAVKERLLQVALGRKEEITVNLPPKDGRMLSYLHKYGTVLKREMVDGKLSVLVKIERRYMKPLADYIESPEPAGGTRD